MKFILIYTINEYPELGGGTFFEKFDDIDKLNERINQIAERESYDFDFCGTYLHEYQIEAIEKVTKYQIKL